MADPHEERIRIEISYPSEHVEVFNRVKTSVEEKYPDVDIKGKETERVGSEVMITLAFVPKSHRMKPPEGTGADGKPYESTPTSSVHDFVSALIEEYSAEEK